MKNIIFFKVETFLGLNPEITRSNFVFNSSKGFFCLRPNGSVETHCMDKTKGLKHPRVTESTLSALRKHFAPHNKRLYKMAGRSFYWPEE